MPDDPGYRVEPDPEGYAFIDDPTSKCDSPDCFSWFDVARKSCPMCGCPRGMKRRKCDAKPLR